MKSSLIPVRTFDRDSGVTAHWLTRCEGFRVRSRRRRGVVESVVLDPTTWHAAYLVVRYRRPGRRRIVLASAVDSVVPAEELLVLRSRGRIVGGATAVRRASLGAGRATARGARLTGRGAGATARTTGALAIVAARWSAPRLARGSSALAYGARVAAIWAALAGLVLARGAYVLTRRGAVAAARSWNRDRPSAFEQRPARR